MVSDISSRKRDRTFFLPALSFEGEKNRFDTSTGASQYIGVHSVNNGATWQVSRMINGKNYNGGTFSSEIEAAKKSDELVRQFGGSNYRARLNFPTEVPVSLVKITNARNVS